MPLYPQFRMPYAHVVVLDHPSIESAKSLPVMNIYIGCWELSSDVNEFILPH